MFTTINNREKYIPACEVSKLPILYNDRMNVKLFNKNISLNTNPWLWHLHIKVTDACNAKCKFCIEQNCVKNENSDNLLKNIDLMLAEMQRNNCLFSVSVTGGEPTLYKDFDKLCEILKKYPIHFLTMNTNGYGLDKHKDIIDGLFDFINISRHSADDAINDKIFCTHVLSKQELKEVRAKYQHTKFRIQCVMGNGINTIENMNELMDAYNFVDDFSFRRLMETGDEFGLNYNIDKDGYFKTLNYAFNNWTFKEQTIQDYYVYEIYNNGKTDITFSYSDMKMLREVERMEDDDIFREFICHPDGTISGSWKKDCKIIIR